MNAVQVALYARVSSEQQTENGTIESQIAVLCERIEADGYPPRAATRFIDDGYSGTTLVRPALEKLRDSVALGAFERLYVLDPDRLSRSYAYQVLLMDELQQAGTEVIFLNRELSQSPEDQLLLQVQGVIAEYERTKILERSRRGKRYAAQSGEVSVLGKAPYGYRYIPKQAGGGQARYEIELNEARVVQQIFQWAGYERVSLGEVCRRLTKANIPTRTGKTVWDRSVIWGMLKNPAYKGMAAYGKQRCRPLHPRLRAQRGKSLQPKRAVSVEDVPQSEWISIAVPALVDEAVFEAVQQQLRHNQQATRQHPRGATHLLQGLLTCANCGHAYYGQSTHQRRRDGELRHYCYYRCIGRDGYRFGGQARCHNATLPTHELDQFVWNEVCRLLQDSNRLTQEFRRRLAAPDTRQRDLNEQQAQITKVRQSMVRLIDGYAEGYLEKQEFEPRIVRLRQRLDTLEDQLKQMTDTLAQQADWRLVITQLEQFAVHIAHRLADADWQLRRDLICMLVKEIKINDSEIEIVFRIAPPFELSPRGGILQHRWQRLYANA